MDRPSEKINPDGTIKKNLYDDAKNIAYITDENKNQTSYIFDGLGKLVEVKEEQSATGTAGA